MFALAQAAVLWLVAAAALPPQPARIEPTAEQRARLLAGELVGELQPAPALSTALLVVDAPPEVVLEAVMDLEARVADIEGLKSITRYEVAPPAGGGRATGATWVAGKIGLQVSFSVIYEYDLAAGWSVFNLDTSRDNDVDSAQGSYQAYPWEGKSLLVYRNVSSLPGWVPGVVRAQIDSSGASELLHGIKRRAEASRSR